MKNAAKKDKKKMELTKEALEEANKLFVTQEKIFTAPFNIILRDIVADVNKRHDIDEELIYNISSVINKQNIGNCIVALTYMLSLVASDDMFMKALNNAENNYQKETQTYIG